MRPAREVAGCYLVALFGTFDAWQGSNASQCHLVGRALLYFRGVDRICYTRCIAADTSSPFPGWGGVCSQGDLPLMQQSVVFDPVSPVPGVTLMFSLDTIVDTFRIPKYGVRDVMHWRKGYCVRLLDVEASAN